MKSKKNLKAITLDKINVARLTNKQQYLIGQGSVIVTVSQCEADCDFISETKTFLDCKTIVIETEGII